MCCSKYCTRMPSGFSRVGPFASLWIVARQDPLSMASSRQEHCNGLPCPPPGDVPNSGTEPSSLMSPAWSGFSTWEALQVLYFSYINLVLTTVLWIDTILFKILIFLLLWLKTAQHLMLIFLCNNHIVDRMLALWQYKHFTAEKFKTN